MIEAEILGQITSLGLPTVALGVLYFDLRKKMNAGFDKVSEKLEKINETFLKILIEFRGGKGGITG